MQDVLLPDRDVQLLTGPRKRLFTQPEICHVGTASDEADPVEPGRLEVRRDAEDGLIIVHVDEIRGHVPAISVDEHYWLLTL